MAGLFDKAGLRPGGLGISAPRALSGPVITLLAEHRDKQFPDAFAWRGSDRRLAKSDADYETNLQFALSLQLSALRYFSKADDPRGWGIVQHNLGCAYISLSDIRTDESKSVADIENAIHHAERSFEVRNPDDSLQYWVASCRTLGGSLENVDLLDCKGCRQVRSAFVGRLARGSRENISERASASVGRNSKATDEMPRIGHPPKVDAGCWSDLH